MTQRLAIALLLSLGLVACGDRGGSGGGGGERPASGHGSGTGTGGGRGDGGGRRAGGGDSGGSRPFAIDQSSPRSIVEGIFEAARKGEFAALAAILAPVGADGDARDIAGMATADPDHQAQFRAWFSTGKISGEVEEAEDSTLVSILFGPDGTKPETLRLVRVDGKWYLESL
jgi:hypothetical protein